MVNKKERALRRAPKSKKPARRGSAHYGASSERQGGVSGQCTHGCQPGIHVRCSDSGKGTERPAHRLRLLSDRRKQRRNSDPTPKRVADARPAINRCCHRSDPWSHFFDQPADTLIEYGPHEPRDWEAFGERNPSRSGGRRGSHGTRDRPGVRSGWLRRHAQRHVGVQARRCEAKHGPPTSSS